MISHLQSVKSHFSHIDRKKGNYFSYLYHPQVTLALHLIICHEHNPTHFYEKNDSSKIYKKWRSSQFRMSEKCTNGKPSELPNVTKIHKWKTEWITKYKHALSHVHVI